MKRTVVVEIDVTVTVNAKKFTKKFMEDFRKQFYPFQTIDDHLKHLGQLAARGLAANGSFIEGYGQAEDMGITFHITDQDETVVRQ